MVKSAKTQDEHFERDDDGELGVKVEEKSRGSKVNTIRSKHSETEQRRRSKINERFQILRDIIPHNDEKRDKASFLLEVIEYIQFLQEKLNMHEGSYSYQGWNSEPTKLTPWKNSSRPAEGLVDHSQVIKKGSDYEKNTVVSPAKFTNAQSMVGSDFSTAAVVREADQLYASATQAASHVTMQPNVFDSIVRSSVSIQPLGDPTIESNSIASKTQSQVHHGGTCTATQTIPNHMVNNQDELNTASGSVSMSNAYSQGLLNTLTQSLQSSGVNLSQASISVKFDVGKRTINGTITPAESCSKDLNDQSLSHQAITQMEVERSFNENSERAHKSLRSKKI